MLLTQKSKNGVKDSNVEWNFQKYLLNEKGEFISADDGADLLAIADANAFNYADVDNLGLSTFDDSYLDKHIQSILEMDLVNGPLLMMN